ncbi:hypothetical protein Tco_0349222 [Tanacetum coccineum]
MDCDNLSVTQDTNLWDVIVNGDLEEEPAPTRETSAPPAPKTAKQLAAKRNQERVKNILLLAIPDECLLKFHNVAVAKSLWEESIKLLMDELEELDLTMAMVAMLHVSESRKESREKDLKVTMQDNAPTDESSSQAWWSLWSRRLRTGSKDFE